MSVAWHDTHIHDHAHSAEKGLQYIVLNSIAQGRREDKDKFLKIGTNVLKYRENNNREEHSLVFANLLKGVESETQETIIRVEEM